MNELIKNFIEYTDKILGISVRPEKWTGAKLLPVFLQELYEFYEVKINEQDCILFVNNNKDEKTPASIQKHYFLLQKNFTGVVIYVSNSIISYNRQRLIGYKIPFVVPHNQLYIPDFGIDFRKYLKKQRSEKKAFSPSTQAIILYALLKKEYGPFTAIQLADILGYSKMTLSRVFDDIKIAELGGISCKGHENILAFTVVGRDLWESALPYLQSPVQKSFWLRIQENVSYPLAGLSALSHYSMLAEPQNTVYAIGSETAEDIYINQSNKIIPDAEQGAINIEKWRYSPDRFASNGIVDQFSLYLSLQGSTDERVEAALEEMMGTINW